LDSLNAILLARLSLAYYSLENPKSDKLARRALELDPENETVNYAMGMARVQAWDWAEADKFLDKALMGGPLAQGGVGKLRNAARLGKYDEAVRVGKEAIQYSPLNRGLYYYLGLVYIHVGKFDEALAQAGKLEEMGSSPTWPHELKAEVYLLQNKNNLALAEALKIPEGAIRSYYLCMTYSSLKDKSKADAQLKNYMALTGRKTAFALAEIYSWRGEPDEAMRWLEIAYTKREAAMFNINTSAWLKPMKKDKRFKDMVSKMNLPLLD
jgi:tetratricopeptide (TPR) repeat protein